MTITRRILSMGVLALTLGTGWFAAARAQPLPSANVPPSAAPGTPAYNDWFLSYNDLTKLEETIKYPRIDSAASACAYYLAIKAVTGCGSNGELINPITFDKWKEAAHLGKHTAFGKKEDRAQFINRVDLNLTRDHHLISYPGYQMAGYVCNHAGPVITPTDPTGLFPPQSEIDALIRNIKLKQKLIACVAMEYSDEIEFDPNTPTTNAFIRFFIFGADGSLLPSVSLDDRGPKFMPHVCTACHGGPFAFENLNPATGNLEFDVSRSPNGNLQAHFLPFDMANFAFSSKLTDAEREDAIYRLNLDIVLSLSSNDSISELIDGWYEKQLFAYPPPPFNTEYVAPAWDKFTDVYRNAYKNGYAHSCRTCHVAMDNFPFERDLSNISGHPDQPACWYSMPNAEVTFNRFWLSANPLIKGQPTPDPPDQPTALAPLIGTCNPPP